MLDDYNKSITHFDTSIGSLNVGDEIINDSAYKHLKDIFPMRQFIRLTTHDGISNVGLNRSSVSDYRFICGSNLLNSNLILSQQWNFTLLDFIRMKNMIVMGVGWSNYQANPSIATSWVLRNRLDPNYYHSVRDTYTETQLKSIGIKNVINTSCPTMWDLNEAHCEKIPTDKSENVVFTLTDYRPDVRRDEYLISTLKRCYDNVYFWVQGSKDLSYFYSLDNSIKENIIIIPPSLNDYDEILDSELSLDFVGTRLHAGIRALQKSRRTIIIGVDNRAIEKNKDFNIPVILRTDLEEKLFSMIESKFKTEINLPEENIRKWKMQFSNN
ncbi:capsular biosynthesis protein [Vibrio lentus]|uniref:Capsular biosynthesis protein n=1 Tax=Vibrio lentus TaxID=136468 RepID=A0AB36XKS4_9VIBR|nr:capsular biosynthesis protein [Vibrio lentus]PMK31574.1 capsular biosynthesis protein [Vibrio lentus]PMK46471.1 capsular biosynthesis protein [Vibrio lentus]PML34223.1 capsular biosynthesis protein [Vibrio lentus]PMM30973.1 capsular biosynthesis protein [Vibrio lentus]